MQVGEEVMPSLPGPYLVPNTFSKGEGHRGAELCLGCSRDLLLLKYDSQLSGVVENIQIMAETGRLKGYLGF